MDGHGHVLALEPSNGEVVGHEKFLKSLVGVDSVCAHALSLILINERGVPRSIQLNVRNAFRNQFLKFFSNDRSNVAQQIAHRRIKFLCDSPPVSSASQITRAGNGNLAGAWRAHLQKRRLVRREPANLPQSSTNNPFHITLSAGGLTAPIAPRLSRND